MLIYISLCSGLSEADKLRLDLYIYTLLLKTLPVYSFTLISLIVLCRTHRKFFRKLSLISRTNRPLYCCRHHQRLVPEKEETFSFTTTADKWTTTCGCCPEHYRHHSWWRRWVSTNCLAPGTCSILLLRVLTGVACYDTVDCCQRDVSILKSYRTAQAEDACGIIFMLGSLPVNYTNK